jgi:hypothetical protein
MLTIAECRKILGNKYKNCTDKQIEMIRELLYLFAEMDVKRLLKNKRK